MKTVLALLDAAYEICGRSDAELARRMGVAHSHPAEWRSGERRMTPATVGLLADLVGLPAEEAQRLALLSVVDGVKDPKKQGVLRRVFFALSELSGPAHGGKPKIAALAIRPIEARVPVKQHGDAELTERALVQADEEPDIHWRGVRNAWERAALLLRAAMNVICPAQTACS